jgi:hypothetical protein
LLCIACCRKDGGHYKNGGILHHLSKNIEGFISL